MNDKPEGKEATLVMVVCPNCDFSETYSPSDGEQPELFDLEDVSEDGCIHNWICLHCKTKFFTKIE